MYSAGTKPNIFTWFQQLSLRHVGIFLCLSSVILPLWFPLWQTYAHLPQPDIRTFTPTVGSGLGYALWLLLMMGACWLAYRRAQTVTQPIPLRWIMLGAGVMCLALVWAYPVNANDVYRYFIRGRILSVYHDNPFAAAPTNFPDDPYLPLAGEWASFTSPYGPVWELMAGLISGLASDNLLAGLIAFKLLGALVFLASGWLIWNLLLEWPVGMRLGRTLLWLWNPALLLIFVVDGHNDGLMLFWLLLGVWLWRRGHVHLAWLVLPLAPLTKLIGLLALPFLFLGMWYEQEPERPLALTPQRVRLFLVALLSSLGVAFLTFVPFGSPVDLLVRLLQESREGAGFSPLVLIFFVGRYLGSPPRLDLLANMATGLFVLLAMGLMVVTVRGRNPFRAVTAIFAGYLLQALSFRIWYVGWLFPWMLLDPGERRVLIGFFFLLTSQLSVLIYGHLRVYLLMGDMAVAHLIGIPFTFLLPLLLAGYGSARTPHSSKPQTER